MLKRFNKFIKPVIFAVTGFAALGSNACQSTLSKQYQRDQEDLIKAHKGAGLAYCKDQKIRMDRDNEKFNGNDDEIFDVTADRIKALFNACVAGRSKNASEATANIKDYPETDEERQQKQKSRYYGSTSSFSYSSSYRSDVQIGTTRTEDRSYTYRGEQWRP